jgi:hypothetical protein
MNTGLDAIDTMMMPATATISVFTRHSAKCPKRGDRMWKDCNCRKSLYFYENGESRCVSTRTRSWDEAEQIAQLQRVARDPFKHHSPGHEIRVTDNVRFQPTAAMRYQGACLIAAIRFANEKHVHVGSRRGRMIVEESVVLANQVFESRQGIRRPLLGDVGHSPSTASGANAGHQADEGGSAQQLLPQRKRRGVRPVPENPVCAGCGLELSPAMLVWSPSERFCNRCRRLKPRR